jgi:predicted enzyme related to lactoylglutathione lyase
MKLSFDSIYYHVRDLERSVLFYSNVLGFDLQSRDVVARFLVDGVLLELVPADQDESISGLGNARLCLGVSDIEEARETLRTRGVDVGEVKHVNNGSLAVFSDPDGNELALWQYHSRYQTTGEQLPDSNEG